MSKSNIWRAKNLFQTTVSKIPTSHFYTSKIGDEESINNELKLPDAPTTCCMSACPNCVWIEYANQLNEIFKDGGEKSLKIIEERITDPNMKATLVLDSNGFNRDDRFVFVEEDLGANSSFVLVSLVWRAIITEGKRVLILNYHNSFEHYKFLVSKVGQVQEEQLRFLNGVDLFGMNSVEIFERIRKFCLSERIDYLVLDDLSYHYHLHGLNDTVKFSRNMLNLLNELENFKIVIGLHTTDSNNELMTLSRMFYYLSNFVISVHPLRSGFSAEVTGHLKVRTKAQLINKINTYSYKLDDKHFVLNPIVV